MFLKEENSYKNSKYREKYPIPDEKLRSIKISQRKNTELQNRRIEKSNEYPGSYCHWLKKEIHLSCKKNHRSETDHIHNPLCKNQVSEINSPLSNDFLYDIYDTRKKWSECCIDKPEFHMKMSIMRAESEWSSPEILYPVRAQSSRIVLSVYLWSGVTQEEYTARSASHSRHVPPSLWRRLHPR